MERINPPKILTFFVGTGKVSLQLRHTTFQNLKYLAHPDEARGCSTNIFMMYSEIQDYLPKCFLTA